MVLRVITLDKSYIHKSFQTGPVLLGSELHTVGNNLKILQNPNGHFLIFFSGVHKVSWTHTLGIFIFMLYYTAVSWILSFSWVFLSLQVFCHLEGLGLRNSFILNNLANSGSLIFSLDFAQQLSIPSLAQVLFLIFYHEKLEEASWHFVHTVWEFLQPIHELSTFSSLHVTENHSVYKLSATT